MRAHDGSDCAGVRRSGVWGLKRESSAEPTRGHSSEREATSPNTTQEQDGKGREEEAPAARAQRAAARMAAATARVLSAGGRLTKLAAAAAARSRQCSPLLPATSRRSSRGAVYTGRGMATGAVAGMNATEKYIFDLNGYIIVPQVNRPWGAPGQWVSE